MIAEVEALMQAGKWEDAQVQCEAYVQLQPGNATLNAYLGLCHFRRNEFDKAAVWFRKSVTLEPRYHEAGLKLAQSLDRMMKYKEALEVAKQFLALYPNDAQLRALVNGLQRQHGAEEEESWQKSVKGAWHNVTLSQE
jgi:tetratricopeptide (TPR) repeat protein